MNKVSIILNGKAIEVDGGLTLLQVAKENSLFIPTLCHNEALKPFTSCFLCIVEVKGRRGFVPACATTIQSGMEIVTESEEIYLARKTNLELLLSDHVGDCTAPCVHACPAQTDVQGYIDLIRQKKWVEASVLIRQKLALPFICGTVCPNPCEKECRRGEVDQPLAIRALKRVAIQHDLQAGVSLPTPMESSGHKVAIVGGGPAGLSAAYYLRLKGHEVHLFEREKMLGGMARYGIPRFRLDWNLLDKEIENIVHLGVTLHLEKQLGRDFTLQNLNEEGFKATLLAIGASASKKIGIPGEEGKGVFPGISFLRGVVTKEVMANDLGKKVVVIGGGDVAMDCARVAKRLGCEVVVLYRRTVKEMPATEHERVQAMEEGIDFHFQLSPHEIVIDDNTDSVIAIRLRQVKNNSIEEMSCSAVIIAIGQELKREDIEKDCVETTDRKTIAYQSSTCRVEKREGLFTAGDASLGPQTVVAALAEGKRSAESIHNFLMGNPLVEEKVYEIKRDAKEVREIIKNVTVQNRQSDSFYPAEKRLSGDGYDLISSSMSEQEAVEEAFRCLKCGCKAQDDCQLRRYATLYSADESVWKGVKRNYKLDDSHSQFEWDLNKCINCGICVRYTHEIKKCLVFGWSQRGFKTHPATPFEIPVSQTCCDGCLECVEACPTAALYQKNVIIEGK